MDSFVTDVCRRLYGLHVCTIRPLDSYDDKIYYVDGIFDESHKNLSVEECENGYVLKILNSVDSKDVNFIEGQHSMMFHLHNKCIKTPRPLPNLSGSLFSVEKVPVIDDGDHVVCLFNFISGKLMDNVQYTPKTLYNVGKFGGRMDRMLQGFEHPAYRHHETAFNPSSIPKMRKYLHFVPESDDRDLLLKIIDAFETDIIPLYDRFQSGIIHGDLHDCNIIVEPVEGEKGVGENGNLTEYTVSGIIDFSDSVMYYFVYDIALLITYLFLHSKSAELNVDEAKHALSGYLSEFELSYIELKSLRRLICSRITQSLILAYRKSSEDPSNEYARKSFKKGWSVLRTLWGMTDETFLINVGI